MDCNVIQRKRGGRISKKANIVKQPLNNDAIENSAIAISPTLEEPETSNCAPASECRRSSRKKIIKFDVRDLLNKNRKTHKIQIEARIDSNAPSTSKAAAGSGAVAANLKSPALREDLLSKHKTFLEKSAIFRRYSISQEQKPPPPLPIPPLLSKSNESKDSSFCGTTSSQEFLSQALVKPKQPTSLIVAQIESNKPSVSIPKRKGLHNTPEISIFSSIDSSPIVQQKKRGRPAKIKPQTSEGNVTLSIVPEKAKNWKEYKACLAQQSNSINEEQNIWKIKEQSISTLPLQIKQTHMLLRKPGIFNGFLQSDISRSDDDGSFTGFQISKEDLSYDSLENKSLEYKNVDELPSNLESNKGMSLKDNSASIVKAPTTLKRNDETGDKNQASYSEQYLDQQTSKVSNIKSLNLDITSHSKFNTKQLFKFGQITEDKEINTQDEKLGNCGVKSIEKRNEIALEINRDIKKADIISDECNKEHETSTVTSKTYVVSEVENTSKYVHKLENEQYKGKCVGQIMLKAEKLCAEFKSLTTTKVNETTVKTKTAEENNIGTEMGERSNFALMELGALPQPSTSSYGNKPFSRTSSSSESENTSDYSIYSSEPFSTRSSSSQLSNKSGGMVKVSIKRISLPKSPSTSSQTSTSEELNNVNIKRKLPIAKRSKRIKKKIIGSAKENITNAKVAEMLVGVFEESTNKEDTLKLDEISISSEIRNSNYDYLPVLEKKLKKKSVRARKNKSVEETKFDEAQKQLVEIQPVNAIVEKKEYNSSHEKIINEEKVFVSAKGQSDKSDDRKQEKIPKKDQTPTQQAKTKIENPKPSVSQDSCSIEQKDEIHLNSQSSIITFGENIHFVELHNEDNASIIVKINSVADQTRKETTNSKPKKTHKAETCLDNVDSDMQQCVQSKYEKYECLQKLSPQSTSECQASKKKTEHSTKSTGIVSEENVTVTGIKNNIIETEFDNPDKTDSSKCKSAKQDKLITLQNTAKKENIYAKSSKDSEENSCQLEEEICLTVAITSKQEIGDKTHGISKSPIQNFTRTKFDDGSVATKKDNFLRPGLKFHDKKGTHVELKETLSIELKQKISKTLHKFGKEIKFKNTEEKVEFAGAGGSVECDAQERTPEKINTNNSRITQSETATELNESEISLENITKKVKRGRKDKKEVPVKVASLKEERPTDSAIQQESKKGQETSSERSVNNETCLTEKQTEKLLVVTSEVMQNKMLTKFSEAEKNKIQFHKSEAETLKHTSINNDAQSNSTPFTKTKESHKKTTSGKTFDSPKKTTTATCSISTSEKLEERQIFSAVKHSAAEVTQALENATSLNPHLPSETKHPEPSKNFPESSAFNLKIQGINKVSETEKLIESPLQDNKKPLSATDSTVTKRRGRNQRFKNLHGTEDYETDNSNGTITPIEEVNQRKLTYENVAMESSEKSPERKKKHELIIAEEEQVDAQEDVATNLSTSQIKNVSIETNTLLDILRTVQSNTAAALRASKSPINISERENEHSIITTSKVNKDVSSENSQNSNKNQQDVNTSPVITDIVESTSKKVNLSPERSNSNSPLTLKKVTSSPTRSSSSSPLTLKKVTRRYERRSRRGEDSAHKTLEETFAEIAAQSSKAVLAAKEFEWKSPEELDMNTSAIAEKEVEESPEQVEKISAPSDRNKKVDEVLSNLAQDIEKKEILDEPTDYAETSKTSPTRRGRKPKNRASELPTVANEEEVISGRFTDESKDELKYNEIQMHAEVKPREKHDENKHDSIKVSESLETSLNGIFLNCKENTITSVLKNEATELPVPALKQEEDMNENKTNKKLIEKHETKDKIEESMSLAVAVTSQGKSDEVRTPKQSMKKRDSSLNKSETKLSTKKVQKKVKSDEEDSINLSKEDTSLKNTATTPPVSKRVRKPKNQQADTPQSGSKKKDKNDSYTVKDGEDTCEEKAQLLEIECEYSLDKLLDEKLAKKTRQRKLKEAFEAALADNKEKIMEATTTDSKSYTKNFSFGLKMFSNSPPPEGRDFFSKEDKKETIKSACAAHVETERDPDPLKDIEKFIADGVNLLKKDYKLDENSVDDVIQSTLIKTTEIVDVSRKTPRDDVKLIFNTFETPADTPINTPSVTPPPKSPSSLEPTTPDENSGVRRSHRIKLITKTPKALVGRGLVRDRERFSIKDDVETKSHYTLDDHLTDLAEVEAKNAKFLKEMEERLSNFQVIKENEYLCERVISREARKMICDCFLTHEEEDRGELGCGEDCLNRLLMIECGSECNVKERCTNKRFQKLLCSPCRVFRTEKKGFGIMADIEILPGEFIMEYVGEVINTEEFEKRRVMYSQEKNRHYYFMALRSDAIIDATIKGNISRFINHSCEPNAETQKWTVNGELRIGFFSRKSIMPGEEITFNYQYQRYGREAQRCYCESSNCTGWIGQEPTSDEGEQIDDEDDETEDEEAVTTNLLVQDDEDDSDASVADPEEVQKRLEMAAAQAEVELAPLQLMQEKGKQVQATTDESKTLQDISKSDNEEDSKSKFKKLLSKMAEKVAAKQKQSKREQKLQRKKKSKESSSELTNKLKFLEDPDIEDEVQFLKACGLKNQSDTLRLSRLMVRAKIVQTRLNLLEILRKGDLPCRRLFLDYHGLRLLHGWMSEDAGNMQIRLSLLQTLQTLPIANKTVLTDSKVMQVVRTWSGPSSNFSPNEDSSSSNSNSQDMPVQSSTAFDESSEIAELQKLALKLTTVWEGLPEIFRIPKKERIEQMKEHEREADRQYAANAEIQENTIPTDRYRRDRFGRGLNTPSNSANTSNRFTKPNNGNPHKTPSTTPENLKNLSKAQRRELFAAKVARDEAEKRLAEERREFETKCRFFGLDLKKTRAQNMPFCVNPATGQWFSIERKPITTPPSYAHVQVPVKPKSTDPNDYQLPAVCSTLPPQWKYAITPQGKIYYYHIKHRLSQWEPPLPSQLQQCELEAKEEESESENASTAGEDSSDDYDDVFIGMDATQLKAYINRKVESRRQKRYQRLVDERSISPRREEDRIYNQIEVRKYKENKEKIRKRKEDIRRKRAEALRKTSLNLCTLGSITQTISSTSKSNIESDEELGALPIQDYLLSSDEEIDIKAEVNSLLIDKIVEGDKIVDELDALTTKRQLKRPLPPHRDLSDISTPPSTSSLTSALIATAGAAKHDYKQEYKKRKLEKKEKRRPKEQDAKYRKNKEKFRCEIAGIIVHHLKPYLKETCTVGRIQSNEDFNHLSRKLTHFVMIKELKYCESVGQTLVVTESVKSKSREFIKKYMAKYGDVYVKPINDPDFKDIPFSL